MSRSLAFTTSVVWGITALIVGFEAVVTFLAVQSSDGFPHHLMRPLSLYLPVVALVTGAAAFVFVTLSPTRRDLSIALGALLGALLGYGGMAVGLWGSAVL